MGETLLVAPRELEVKWKVPCIGMLLKTIPTIPNEVPHNPCLTSIFTLGPKRPCMGDKICKVEGCPTLEFAASLRNGLLSASRFI